MPTDKIKLFFRTYARTQNLLRGIVTRRHPEHIAVERHVDGGLCIPHESARYPSITHLRTVQDQKPEHENSPEKGDGGRRRSHHRPRPKDTGLGVFHISHWLLPSDQSVCCCISENAWICWCLSLASHIYREQCCPTGSSIYLLSVNEWRQEKKQSYRIFTRFYKRLSSFPLLGGGTQKHGWHSSHVPLHSS